VQKYAIQYINSRNKAQQNTVQIMKNMLIKQEWGDIE